jgi:hypothetical protein
MSCYDCANLNKSRIEEIKNHKVYANQYRYGCDDRLEGTGFICGWIRKDNELKTMGCSCWKAKTKIIQESLF